MKAAFIVFERMTSLDFIGFYDPLTRLKTMNIIDDFEWRICSNSPRVRDDRGLVIGADSVNEPLDACTWWRGSPVPTRARGSPRRWTTRTGGSPSLGPSRSPGWA